MEESLTKIVKGLTGDGDFVQITSEIFKNALLENGIEDIQLFQITSDRQYAKQILFISKESEELTEGTISIELFEENYLKNQGKTVFPIYLREEIAMYVVATKNDITMLETAELVKVTLLVQNIASNKNFQDSLESSYRVLERTLNLVPIGVAILDQKEKNVLLLNKVAAESTAIQNAMGIGLSAHIASGADRIEEIFEEETGLWFDIQFTNLTWINGENVLICTSIDITQKIKNQQKIEYQANNDYLTGLFNRMKYERDLGEIIRQTVENQEKGTVLFLDLDNFKQVNDGLGHQYGDVLLQNIAGTLQSIPEIRNSCYRMGGDEFVIIIRPDKFNKISSIVDAISKRFNEPWTLMDVEYYCTMSMGLAIFPDHGSNVEEVTKNADHAMYEAKKGGKNRYLWYTELDVENIQKKNEFETSIKTLVGNEMKDFEIHYQPIVDCDGKIYGAEALVRINSGDVGKLLPAEFLPVAEYLGIMNRIGDFVFEEALTTLAEWNRTNKDFKMFINMAPTQLMVSKAANKLIDIVKKTGAQHDNIFCEISEKTEYRDLDTALATMEILSAHGINVSIDDYMTGKISLDFLNRSKAKHIKFDNSLKNISKLTKFEKITLTAIIEIAKQLGIETAFVGIETEEQMKAAVEFGTDKLEGFYFGKALPKEEFRQKWI